MRNKLIYLSLICIAFFSTACHQEPKYNALDSLMSQIEAKMILPNSFFTKDQLTSEVDFEITTDSLGVVKNSRILPPLKHSAHGAHLKDILSTIRPLPTNGQAVKISTRVDYAKYAPKALSEQLQKIENTSQPTYNGNQNILAWLIKALSEQEIMQLLTENNAQIKVKLLHKADGSLGEAIIAHNSRDHAIKVFTAKELEELSKGWTAALINRVPHDYYKYYSADLGRLLSEEARTKALADRKAQKSNTYNRTKIMPKFEGENILSFHSHFVTEFNKQINAEFGSQWNKILKADGLIIYFKIRSNGTAVFERMKYADNTIIHEPALIEIASKIIAQSQWTPAMEKGERVNLVYEMNLDFKK